MLDKFLKDVVGMIAGKQVEGIVDLLNSKKYVNEFNIAKKLDLTINQTRNILYKIGDYGLVSFERKKDKKKGWYTYFWKIEILKTLEFLKEILLKNIGELEAQINSRTTKQFYECKRCSIEITEETALLHNFECPECGDVFTLKDNVKIVKDLTRSAKKLKDELALVDVEIEKEKVKLEKEKGKALEKIAKEKAEKRRITREKNAKARALKKKESGGKAVKKKVVKKKAVKKKAVKKKAVKKKVIKKKAIKKKVVKKKSVKKKIAKKTIKSSLKKVSKKVSKAKAVAKKVLSKKASKK